LKIKIVYPRGVLTQLPAPPKAVIASANQPGIKKAARCQVSFK